MKRVTFLLGAGASIPAGFSSTEQITDAIIASECYSRDTEGKYYSVCDFPPQPADIDFRTPVVRSIVAWLRQQICEYYLDRGEIRKPNYEEIYYLASQLSDDSNELQNPVILPALRKLKCEMLTWPEYKEYCHTYKLCDSTIDNFRHFCKETCHYIEYIVAHKLGCFSKQYSCRHLNLIKVIHQADGISLQGIATLAHDTHVERYLKNSGIKLADGFVPPIAGDSLRIWRNEFSDRESLPFLKLHGSVNWNRFHLKNPANYKMLPESEIGVRELNDLEKSLYGFWADLENSSLLLIGTFNKPAQYSWGLMLDIHYRFRKILSDTQTLIVCGYSFGDKAINTQLLFWHGAERNRSIVIIDPRSKDEIIQSARFAAGQLLQNNGAVRFIEKPMQDVKHHELIQVLHDSPS